MEKGKPDLNVRPKLARLDQTTHIFTTVDTGAKVSVTPSALTGDVQKGYNVETHNCLLAIRQDALTLFI